jgi:Kef-type K+ transport system membrane component KefB
VETAKGAALLIIGLMLLAGYLAHVTANKLRVPRVTLLLTLGAVCGPSVLDLVPHEVHEWFPFVTRLALAMVGFLLGESFVGKELRERGKDVLAISLGETFLAAGIVFLAVFAVSQDFVFAILLASVAPASAPAAIFDMIDEAGAQGPLTKTLLGVVAIDDAWGVILFSILLVVAQSVAGEGTHLQQLAHGFIEVGGALVLGFAVGLLMAWITRRVRQGETTLIEAGGFVLSAAGLAGLFELSYLLAAMAVGAALANRRGPDAPAFHDIEHVSQPFLAIFFVLAGLELDVQALTGLGALGATYVGARIVGLTVGGGIVARVSGAPAQVARRIGFCLLPQAGVALGLALLVKEQMPDPGGDVLQIVIASTVLFELAGPAIARWQLAQAGEI